VGNVDGQGVGKSGAGIKEYLTPMNQLGSSGLGTMPQEIHPAIVEAEERAVTLCNCVAERPIGFIRNLSWDLEPAYISRDLDRETRESIEESIITQLSEACIIFKTKQVTKDVVNSYHDWCFGPEMKMMEVQQIKQIPEFYILLRHL
jgi:hypothetical protein